MTTLRNNFAALMSPGLKTVFFNRYNEKPPQFESIFNINTSTRQFEVTQGLTAFGLVPEKPEGRGIQYDDPIQGYNNTYQHLTYALGYRLTAEAYEDDQYKILGPKMSKSMGKSCAVTREILAAAIFNNGFGDVGPDGVSLFNAAHPLEAGGSAGNRPTVPVALSQTSLQTALTAFRRSVDGRGLLIDLKPKYLIVPPELEFYARELIGSMLKPDSQNNNINAVMGSLDIVVLDYLSNPGAWFLATDKEEHSLQWYNRRAITWHDATDFDTQDAKYSIDWRSSLGYDDWRGIYGNPGS